MKKLCAIGVLLAACGGETTVDPEDSTSGNVRDRRAVKPQRDGGAQASDAGALGSDAGVSSDAGQSRPDAGGNVSSDAGDAGVSIVPDAGGTGPSTWETRMPMEGAWDVDLYVLTSTCAPTLYSTADFADVWTFSAVAGQYRNILLGQKVGGPYQRTDYNTWIVDGNDGVRIATVVLTLSPAGVLEGTRSWHEPDHNCDVTWHVEGMKP